MSMQAGYRYFYFKNGDVVAQLQRVVALGDSQPEGGPDAFLASLLFNGQVKEARIGAFLDHDRCEQHGSNTAVIYSRVGIKGRLGTLLRLPLDILKFHPDRILCGRQGYALMVCLVVGRLIGVPVVFSAHNRLFGQAHGRIGKLRERLDAWLIRRCRGAVCHGPYLAEELRQIGVPLERIQVFDSGCGDLVERTAAAGPATTSATPTPRRVLFIGRMIRDKGIFDLFHAFQRLCDIAADSELVYVGDGQDRETLQMHVREQGFLDRVRFLGQLPHAEVGAQIAQSWVVATPTRSGFPEGRCMAAMEALAMGVPLVAPDAGPFPFLVQDHVNGLLFRQDDTVHLADCLRAVYEEPGLRERLAGQALQQRDRLLKPDVEFAAAVSRAFGV